MKRSLSAPSIVAYVGRCLFRHGVVSQAHVMYARGFNVVRVRLLADFLQSFGSHIGFL